MPSLLRVAPLLAVTCFAGIAACGASTEDLQVGIVSGAGGGGAAPDVGAGPDGGGDAADAGTGSGGVGDPDAGPGGGTGDAGDLGGGWPDGGGDEADGGAPGAGTGDPDGGTADAGTPDAGTGDPGGGTADAGTPDAGTGDPDGGTADAGTPDAGTGDADGGAPDAGTPDGGGGEADGGLPPDGGTDSGPPAPPATLPEQLQALATRTVFFAHASVGANVMAGVEALLDANAGLEPTVVGTRSAAAIHAGVWADAYLAADNGYPFQKLAEFRDAIEGGVGGVVEVAFLKFCFADFWDSAGVDATALFAAYQATLAQLRAAHPHVTFVHLTVPLWTATDTNERRERFSDLVRQTYGGLEPVFDVALLESTRPDGTREVDERGVPALVPAYTSDGGHLNEAGREVVARALVAFLAALP
jgi:hypothetical protein